MKFGLLRVYCLELALADYGCDLRRSESGEWAENFFLSGKQRTISQTSGRPYFTKFAHKTWIYVAMNCFGNIFENLPVRGLFFQKGQLLHEHRQWLPTSGRNICEMNTNRGKSRQVGMPTECWLSIYTVGINSKWFPWPVERAHRVYFRMLNHAWFRYLKNLTAELLKI